MLRYVRDWIFTIPLLICIGVMLFALDPVVRVVRRVSLERFEWIIGQLQLAIVRAFWIANVRVQIEEAPGVDRNQPALFVSNHQSNFDVPLLGALLRATTPKFPANSKLASGLPVVSFTLRRGGFAILDLDKPRDALRALREMAVEADRRGVSIVIFPEGTRARDGVLRPFREAGTMALLRWVPTMPVVPVTIDGAAHLMKHGLFPAPFGARVRVRLGEPIARHPGEDPADIIDRARADMEKTLTEWRAV